MRRNSLTACLALSSMAALGVSGCSSSSPEAVDHLAAGKLKAALKASYAKGSVHVVDVTTAAPAKPGGKAQVTTLTADIARGSAAETIVGPDGSQTDLVMQDGTIYVRSTPTVLAGSLGLSEQAASTYGGRWLSIAKTDGAYPTVAAALTIEAEVAPYVPTTSSARVGKPRFLVGTKVKVLPISGSFNDTGMANPVKAETAVFINQGSGLVQGGSIVVASKASPERKLAVFTDWGKPIAVTAPSAATPYAEAYRQ